MSCITVGKSPSNSQTLLNTRAVPDSYQGRSRKGKALATVSLGCDLSAPRKARCLSTDFAPYAAATFLPRWVTDQKPLATSC